MSEPDRVREKVNLAEKLALFSDLWSPRIVGELNGQQVKLARLKGDIVPHTHAEEDELFLVLKGRLILEMPGRRVEIREGELFIVPRGVEHHPIAEEETHVLLFEPASTRHTGERKTEQTVEDQEWI